ncbi:MCE family protein [Nocardia pseudobrasiliensis]|uniref:Phospholipid/cholesterol/gamma-HCH transport system substrate-binding protein n=1 Tax=Nocardia pseudobrasiliensis TaxID=45979 RepID=A0A370I665_9NOCA|nr:MCE family protein [Nocardia pseudobrasiliensis]RDI66209.1 phospholipid/cholesterol/gamma-HCH transport system substrate-binding protein [Nocardia pseudobrasiliensis]
MKRRLRVAGVAIGLAVLLGATGCQWDGLNSLPMPGAAGTGAGSWRVRIQMPNVTTLTRNSPVKVDDVTVGTVTGIEVENWHALVTVSLDRDVKLPANAIARIGQTSLLGSNHVELAAPQGVQPQGQLKNGDTIPLDRAGTFPSTEQTLSSLSVVLNGGGISQLETITHELNATFTGRQDAIRDLLPQLTQLTTTLDQQTGDIIAAMGGLDRFAGQLAQQKDQVAAAIQNIHPALTVLADRRENITKTITALGDLSEVVQRVIAQGGHDLKANLANLWPTLQSLADTGDRLANSLQLLLTFPFPIKGINKAVKGDYMNLFVTYDLTGARMDSNWLTGTPLGGAFGGVQAKYGVEAALGTIAGTAGVKGDPVQGPLQPPQPTPSIPGLPPIPGLPAIPGLTVPGAPQGGPGQ